MTQYRRRLSNIAGRGDARRATGLKRATGLWIAVVVLAFVLGRSAGTPSLTDAESGSGESVLVQSSPQAAGSPVFRGPIQAAALGGSVSIAFVVAAAIAASGVLASALLVRSHTTAARHERPNPASKRARQGGPLRSVGLRLRKLERVVEKGETSATPALVAGAVALVMVPVVAAIMSASILGEHLAARHVSTHVVPTTSQSVRARDIRSHAHAARHSPGRKEPMAREP